MSESILVFIVVFTFSLGLLSGLFLFRLIKKTGRKLAIWGFRNRYLRVYKKSQQSKVSKTL